MSGMKIFESNIMNLAGIKKPDFNDINIGTHSGQGKQHFDTLLSSLQNARYEKNVQSHETSDSHEDRREQVFEKPVKAVRNTGYDDRPSETQKREPISENKTATDNKSETNNDEKGMISKTDNKQTEQTELTDHTKQSEQTEHTEKNVQNDQNEQTAEVVKNIDQEPTNMAAQQTEENIKPELSSLVDNAQGNTIQVQSLVEMEISKGENNTPQGEVSTVKTPASETIENTEEVLPEMAKVISETKITVDTVLSGIVKGNGKISADNILMNDEGSKQINQKLEADTANVKVVKKGDELFKANEQGISASTIKTTEQGIEGEKILRSMTSLSEGMITKSAETDDPDGLPVNKQDNSLSVNKDNNKTEIQKNITEMPEIIKKEGKDNNTDAALNSTIKSIKPEEENRNTKIEDLLSRVNKNSGDEQKTEIKQDHIRQVKAQEYVEEKYLTQGSFKSDGALNRVVPEFAEKFYRENGFIRNTEHTPKPVRINTENNHISMVAETDAKGLEGKMNGPSLASSVTRSSGFTEVVNKIVYAAKGERSLGVTVDHKDLGKLNIKLSLEKGMVHVHINTADKAAREFVESNIQQIVESLTKNGVSVGGFSVGLRNHQNNAGYDNGTANQGNKEFSIDRAAEKEYVRAATNVYGNNGLVNVFA